MDIKKAILENSILNMLFFTFYGKLIWYGNKISGNHFEKIRFKKNVGYFPNLNDPKSFNEKVVWKKINDRREILIRTADKYEVRKYVKEKLGYEGMKYLIPILYHTDDPKTIPFNKLPYEFVIKSNHGSGRNIIVRHGEFDRKDIIRKFKMFLRQPYGLDKVEWAYKNIQRKILVEQLLQDEKGKVPKDYKFFIFHGRCKLVQVDIDRFEQHTRSLYDENWNYIDASLKFPKGKKIPRPKLFSEMKKLAEKLGEDFDFVRVDLYTTEDNIYIGELTHYPGSGNEMFTPRTLDFELGKEWKIR